MSLANEDGMAASTPWQPEIRPEAASYYRRYQQWPIRDVLSDLRTVVDEWRYDDDPHGYCHQRPLLTRALQDADRLRAAIRAAYGLAEEAEADSAPAYPPMWASDLRAALDEALGVRK